jgi:prevent-host-death family protein
MPKAKDARKEPERVTATEAYRNFAAYVGRAQFGNERFIVTQHGQDAVAIISAAELERLEGVVT